MISALLALALAGTSVEPTILYPGQVQGGTSSPASPVVLRAPFGTTGCFTSPTASFGEALTETRASSATKIVSGVMSTCTSNQLRVDGNGALIEPGATNVLLRSGNIENIAWSNTGPDNVVAADTQTLPDGTSGGTKISTATISEAYGRYQPFTYTAAAYTFSAFAKKGTYSCLTLDMTNAGTAGATFNLNTGAVGYTDAGVTATITAVGSWYRVTVTRTQTAVASFPEMYLSSNCTTNGRVWTPVGTENLYVWGAQLETGPVATSYIATAGTTVARAADNASAVASGYALAGSLSLAADVKTYDYGAERDYLQLYVDSNNRFKMYTNTSAQTICDLIVAGVDHTAFLGSTSVGSHHILCKFDGTTLSACVDGTCGTGTPGVALPATYTTLYFDNAGSLEPLAEISNVCFGRSAGACP